MAATVQGTALTRTHRQAQLAIRAALIKDLTLLWRLFDGSQESYERFTELATVLINTRYADSAGLAGRYYREFLVAEGVATRVTPSIAAPLPVEQVQSSLWATGFAGTRRARRLGFSMQAALENGLVLASGAASRLALEGGRQTVIQTTQTDGLVSGWIRVPSGRACAFCAMLASRGPAYKESTVAFQAHDHCSCVPEPYYDGSAWPAVNKQYRDQWYDTTAGKGGKDALNAFRASLEGRAN